MAKRLTKEDFEEIANHITIRIPSLAYSPFKGENSIQLHNIFNDLERAIKDSLVEALTQYDRKSHGDD